MCQRNLSVEIYSGTAGGSLSGILAAISFGDLAQTVILSVVGTVVSFIVSVCLKRLMSKKKLQAEHEAVKEEMREWVRSE